MCVCKHTQMQMLGEPILLDDSIDPTNWLPSGYPPRKENKQPYIMPREWLLPLVPWKLTPEENKEDVLGQVQVTEFITIFVESIICYCYH